MLCEHKVSKNQNQDTITTRKFSKNVVQFLYSQNSILTGNWYIWYVKMVCSRKKQILIFIPTLTNSTLVVSLNVHLHRGICRYQSKIICSVLNISLHFGQKVHSDF